MLDYDKLFAPGNVIGIKNCDTNYIHVISIPYNSDIDKFECYKNPELSTINIGVKFKIIYIIRLNEKGEVVEKIYSVKFPKLETGMFIKISDINTHESYLGYINTEYDKIVYQDGDWDILSDVISHDGVTCKIVEIYKCNGFNGCINKNSIWRL